MLSICKLSVAWYTTVSFYFMSGYAWGAEGYNKKEFQGFICPVSTAESAELCSSPSNWISYVAKSLHSTLFTPFCLVGCKDCANLHSKFTLPNPKNLLCGFRVHADSLTSNWLFQGSKNYMHRTLHKTFEYHQLTIIPITCSFELHNGMLHYDISTLTSTLIILRRVFLPVLFFWRFLWNVAAQWLIVHIGFTTKRQTCDNMFINYMFDILKVAFLRVSTQTILTIGSHVISRR